MPAETRPTRTIVLMTVAAVVIAAILGAVSGVYLGRRYRPSSAPVQIARQPTAANQTPAAPPPAGTPTAAPGAAVPAAHPESTPPAAQPSHSHPPSSTAEAKHALHPSTAARSVKASRQGAAAALHRKKARPPYQTAVRPHRPSSPAAAHRRAVSEHPQAGVRLARAQPPSVHLKEVVSRREQRARAAARARRRARVVRTERHPLRLAGVMRPVRPLPAPRWERQQRIAHRLAASRAHRVRVARRWRRRRALIAAGPARLVPIREQPDALLAQPMPIRTAGELSRPRPLSPAVRARLLARAVERVRYLEQPVVLDGRPAMLATYIVWAHRQPRTFSFVRQDQRTDLAKIVAVDEAARQIRVLVPDRGALIQAAVPTTTVVVYGQALQLNPPAPELIARADALAAAAPAPILGPPSPEAVPIPPVERVAGMREQTPELVGLVRSVDPVSRVIVLAGPRQRTPFRVGDDLPLPQVGQIISISTTESRRLPRPALSITTLQPTVAGVVSLVRPTAVELSVRTVTPDGQVEEIPVPVSGDARVFINNRPQDLRALKRGIYIRAFMTPTGEARILGAPSE